MRYWIRDREKRPHGAPLGQLVRRVRELLARRGCVLALNEAHGQGARVDGLELELARRGPVPISFELLDELSRGSEEWLSDLEVEVTCAEPALAFRFGLHDGAALYVDAPRDLSVALLKPFKDIHPDPGWLGQLRP